MGTADIIPGISGGTIAFIMGFYEELIESVKSISPQAVNQLVKGSFYQFFQLIHWRFLIGLVSGIALAMVCLAHTITGLLNHETSRMFLYALFFGLIIAATLLCLLQLKKFSLPYLIAFMITTFLAFHLTGYSATFSEQTFDVKMEGIAWQANNYDANTKMLLHIPKKTLAAMLMKGIIQPETLVYSHHDSTYGRVDQFIQKSHSKYLDEWVIFCGAVAISAMFLPGISGSYILNMMGMYAPVLGALTDFTGGLVIGYFDSNAFLILLNMLIGIFLGAIAFTYCVSWILHKYHNLAVAALSGFMVGAMRSVWPFWNYQTVLNPLHLQKGPQLEPTAPYLPEFFTQEMGIALCLALVGAMLVFALHHFAKKNAPQTTV